jgi:two-component system NtrC family sensor kinase
MQRFEWTPQLDTGIESVDEQHRHLVDLLNRIIDLERDGRSADLSVVDAILGELAEYASFHFLDEENLMEARRIDRHHLREHQQQHSDFIQQVEAIWEQRGSQDKPVEALLNLLTTWLAKHIMEEDQSMARQIRLIGQGMSPDRAYASERKGG